MSYMSCGMMKIKNSAAWELNQRKKLFKCLSKLHGHRTTCMYELGHR